MEPSYLKKPRAQMPPELQAALDELKRYEASLRRWDMQLQEREDTLEQAELAAFDEDGGCGQALLDEDGGCDCGFEEMSRGCGCGWCGELREGVAAGGHMAKSYTQFQVASEKPPSREELSFLNKLYKLKDGRKG